ncbi:unnamed protein product [Linum tenue]|uniref:Uncharacterized protein n=1 Tax=Linum tenue TaxID=586396 RepID=A0AAV0Q973_9ROSI|nr:unnamed protein product [Linum tenue]
MASRINSLNKFPPCCLLITSAFLFLVFSSLVLAIDNKASIFPPSAASPAARTRKVLLAAVKGSNKGFIFAAGGAKAADHQEELRSVPSGPDPLHHNGGSPKKPRPSP